MPEMCATRGSFVEFYRLKTAERQFIIEGRGFLKNVLQDSIWARI